MLKNIKESIVNFITSRYFVLILAFAVMCVILIHRIFVLQIVNGSEYLDEFTLKIRKERTIASSRGNIYDRNGELLAYNELAYSVTIEDVYESGRDKNKNVNSTIYTLIQLIEQNGDSVVSDFNIYIDDNGEFAFAVSGTSLQRFLADIYGHPYVEDLTYEEKTSTAEDVIAYLAGKDKFGIGEYEVPDDRTTEFIVGKGYSKSMLLKIVTIRYEMSLNSFQKYIPTPFWTSLRMCSLLIMNIR